MPDWVSSLLSPLLELSLHMVLISTFFTFNWQKFSKYTLSLGTLGETLSDNPDLYISRDGGISWHETLSKSFGVNVLDHGGIIVAVNDYHQVQSTTLKYSCNEGLTWSNFEFTNVKFLHKCLHA